MVDYIADYLENIGRRRVIPEVKPGYMRELLPGEAPKTPDNWPDIMKDVENTIMPGVSHENSILQSTEYFFIYVSMSFTYLQSLF